MHPHPDFPATMFVPRSEAFAEDLLEFEERQPEPESSWLTPYSLPIALLLVASAALLVR
jgi:hypothetical protein